MESEAVALDSRTYVSDPLYKDVRPYEKTLQSKEWNEFQRQSEMNALEVPHFIRTFQTTRLVKLAGVKTGIYNPLLPTIKQMQRDSTLGKLADEHCRFTTNLSKADFNSKTFYLNQPPIQELYSLSTSFDGQRLLGVNPRDLQSESENFQVPEYSRDEPQFNRNINNNLVSQSMDSMATINYASRIKNPTITRGWKYHLNNEKSFDDKGRVPWSSEKTNTFRDFRVNYSRYLQPLESRKKF